MADPRLLETIRIHEFNEFAGYKINVQKSYILYTNKEAAERKSKENVNESDEDTGVLAPKQPLSRSRWSSRVLPPSLMKT